MKVELSKLDVAKGQLETAATLFFNEGDVVSVHTLTRASHEILEKLCAGKDIKSMHQEIMSNVREERREEFRAIVDEPKNFFKHASHDGDKTIEFDSASSEFFLWDACRLYQSLAGKIPKIPYLFYLWFNLKHPNLFLSQDIQGILAQVAEGFNLEDKQLFYEEASSAYDLTSMAATGKK